MSHRADLTHTMSVKRRFRRTLRHIRTHWPMFVALYGALVAGMLLIGLSLALGWFLFIPFSLVIMLLAAYFLVALTYVAYRINDAPGGTAVNEGGLYVNPASAGADQTLLGIADNGSGRLGGEVDVGYPLAHGGGQFAVDDADQRLPGLERAQHFLAQRLLFDAGNEVAHHGQRHVSFEQGHAHLAQHVRDVGLGDAGLATHLLDEAREFVGKGGGHRVFR